LNQISREVNIKIGHDNVENDMIIKNLIETEQRKCEEFLGDNPEIGLPTKIDIDLAMTTTPLKGNGDIQEHSFQGGSIEEQRTLPLWSEVVRKGKNRSKSRSRKENFVKNDRRILEY
jgi:hypothetical protein